MKLFAVLFAIFVVSICGNTYGASSKEFDPCSVQRRCSFEEILVRAVGTDNTCLLFRNECLFTNDLCARRANNQPALKKVNRTECRSKCIEVCTADYRPVCAEHNGSEHTFSNKCTMQRLACEREKSYITSYDGECKNAVSTD